MLFQLLERPLRCHDLAWEGLLMCNLVLSCLSYGTVFMCNIMFGTTHKIQGV